MKDQNKINRREVVKVNRQWLLSLVQSLEIAADEVVKNGNAPMWTSTTPSESIKNVASAMKKEALKD